MTLDGLTLSELQAKRTEALASLDAINTAMLQAQRRLKTSGIRQAASNWLAILQSEGVGSGDEQSLFRLLCEVRQRTLGDASCPPS